MTVPAGQGQSAHSAPSQPTPLDRNQGDTLTQISSPYHTRGARTSESPCPPHCAAGHKPPSWARMDHFSTSSPQRGIQRQLPAGADMAEVLGAGIGGGWHGPDEPPRVLCQVPEGGIRRSGL